MLPFLKVLIRTLVIVLIILVIFSISSRLLTKIPGVFVSLSVIAMGIFSFALYKGSFHAVGLHTKKSVTWALIASSVLFLISTAILIFVGEGHS